MIKSTTFLSAILLVLSAAPTYADPSIGDILNTLHQSNQREIQFGQLAQERGFSPQAKELGKALVNDHETADDLVVNVAVKEGVTLREQRPPLTTRQELDYLGSKTGAAFDAALSRNLISNERRDVQNLQAVHIEELPPEIRELVSNFMPMMQRHITMAQDVGVQLYPINR